MAVTLLGSGLTPSLLKMFSKYDTLGAANMHFAIPNLMLASRMPTNTNLIRRACSGIVALKIKSHPNKPNIPRPANPLTRCPLPLKM